MSNSREAMNEVTPKDLVESHKGHPMDWNCMECGEDAGRVASVSVIQTTEICRCRKRGITYDHLVDRLHHAECFKKKLIADVPPTD